MARYTMRDGEIYTRIDHVIGQHELSIPEIPKEIYFIGSPQSQMPLLISGKDEQGNVIDVPRDPASFAYILEQRMEAPKYVKKVWQTTDFFTADGSFSSRQGDNLVVLDAQALREMTPESKVDNGALVLSDSIWNELKAQKEGVLYLTAEEVEEAEGKGYIKKGKIWAPANKTVGKVWDHLGRGQNLNPHVQLKGSLSRYDEVMRIYLNRSRRTLPTMKSLVFDNNSDANGHSYLILRGHLGGIARQRTLEARV